MSFKIPSTFAILVCRNQYPATSGHIPQTKSHTRYFAEATDLGHRTFLSSKSSTAETAVMPSVGSVRAVLTRPSEVPSAHRLLAGHVGTQELRTRPRGERGRSGSGRAPRERGAGRMDTDKTDLCSFLSEIWEVHSVLKCVRLPITVTLGTWFGRIESIEHC